MPRAGLSATVVTAAAADLADEVGLARLTLSALAERLGVRLPSLYKHIDSLDGLCRNIGVQAKGELAVVLGRAAVGRSRGEAITALSKQYRAWALEHPGRYAAVQRAPAVDDPDDQVASAAVVQIIADVLVAYGLHDDDAIDAIRVFRSALHGFVSLETGGAFGLPVEIDRSFDRLVDGLIAALDRWNDPLVEASG
jgi:AcrR family transcriptional regulator